MLHVDFDVLSIHLADTEKNLLTIHGESLLEKLDVLSFTDSNQHILKASQGILLDLGGVLVGHMLSDDRQQRLDVRSEVSAHILRNLG